ncbi:hypothetical protein [Enhygromyxa salina]|uniref:Lipoprotein n=1 Tax=Enhygromyxa salina TaxID=215803 RepID=A0A2S9XTC6_9BACT|nr:hypothetical protein [Enhygromyxa salina]PRP96105.1 hypothetical protein ENSA7_69190 [Enhygromyxa salina]
MTIKTHRTHPTAPTTLRANPALRALTLAIATTCFACESEPVDDAPPSAELVVTPGETELTNLEVEAVHEYAARAEAVFIGEVTGIDYQLSDPDEDGAQLPFTVITWSVEDGIKGVATGRQYAARFLGGPVPDGKVLTVSEIPVFELGDRDLLFIEGNGERGCPLVGGNQGRVQLLSQGDAGDGVSRVAAGAQWPGRAAASIRDAGLGGGEAQPLDLSEPFVFEGPRVATPDELAAAHARHQARATAIQAAAGETEADRAERAALEANQFNPVIAR